MKRKTAAQSIFMDKYTNKKKLGKGAYGDVFLVEDPSKELFALKVIDKKKLEGDNEDMFEYLVGEVEVMKAMNFKHLTKLVEFLKDDNNYYMVLEYCDGGDLVNEQVKCPNMVFPLDQATSYLSQVIKGLEQLHNEGYLHRDIKMQNVLIKNEDG